MNTKITPNVKLGICLAIGAALWLLFEPAGLDAKAWKVFSVFLAVIISFILRPYPLGMSVLIGLLILVGTGTITLKESLYGYSDMTVWLVIAAFIIADAMLRTGLGTRIALNLVLRLGRSMKGLAYAICGSEFLLASVLPSNTARGGGIHAPIVDSLAHSIEETTNEPSLSGRYLSLVGAHANLIAASMYMTGMAANPLVTKAAADVFDVEFGWVTWLIGSIVPGVISMLVLPQLIYRLAPPAQDHSAQARAQATQQIEAQGRMNRAQKTMAIVLVSLLVLWGTQFIHHLPTTLIAWLGVAALLLTQTLTWDHVIENSKAWDTLFWLGGLLTMAHLLSTYGYIQWFVDHAQTLVSDISGLWVVLILALIYFYSMYAFSMLTGHIAAMIVPFFAVCLAAGAPPMMTVAIFAYFSCLCGCITNYSSGPVIIYYGLGYETSRRWFKIGFLVSISHIIIWLGVGLLWWKILGWW